MNFKDLFNKKKEKKEGIVFFGEKTKNKRINSNTNVINQHSYLIGKTDNLIEIQNEKIKKLIANKLKHF